MTVSALLMTFPLLMQGASAYEECLVNALTQNRAEAAALSRERQELGQGFRRISPAEVGLVAKHVAIRRPIEGVGGAPEFSQERRWYWVDPKDPGVPVSSDALRESVAPEALRARIAEIDDELASLKQRQAEALGACKDAKADPQQEE